MLQDFSEMSEMNSCILAILFISTTHFGISTTMQQISNVWYQCSKSAQ